MVEKKTWLISWLTKFLGGTAGALLGVSFIDGFLLIPFILSIVFFVITGVIVYFQKEIEERFATEIAVVEVIAGDKIKWISPELRERLLEEATKRKAEDILKLHRGE